MKTLLLFSFLPLISLAQTLIYRTHPLQSYQIPAMSFSSNSTPMMNEHGDIAIRLVSVEGRVNNGIWLTSADGNDRGQLIYESADFRMLGDPAINDHKQVIFSQFDYGISDGIFSYRPGQGVQLAVDPELYPYTEAFAGLSLDASGQIYFRHAQYNEIRSLNRFVDINTKSQELIEGEGNISFLFVPHQKNTHQVIKVRYGEQFDYREELPDRLLLAKNLGEFQVIAEDTDADGTSPYLSFDNTPKVNSLGQVVFIAKLRDGQRAVFFYDGEVIHQVAKEGADVGSIDFFAACLNAQGVIAFRGQNQQGQPVLYVYKNGSLQSFLTAGQILPSDLGPAQVVSFTGSAQINDQNQLVIQVNLAHPESQTNLGQGLYAFDL